MEITLEKVHKRLLRIQNLLFNNNGENWHPITIDSGWTVGGGNQAPQYMMLPYGFVAVRGQVTHASFTTTVAINSSNPIPAAYRPAVTRFYRASDPQDNCPTVEIDTTGIFQARGGGTFSGLQALLDGIYSL